ncbi:MAG: response regulator transcription factor [Acidobacteria bacterium]|nr:response regulator transcription factor [Acidobacteriota bacterium]
MIRAVLVEDQTLVREGLRSLLALLPDVTVVGEGRDGEEGLAVIARERPDLVLLDLRMPRLDGLGVLRGLSGKSDAPPCLVLTTFDDDALVLDALRAGARGYLLKDVTLETLASAIRIVAGGGSLVQPALTERLSRALAPRENAFEAFEDSEPLTPRETEVLRLLSGGYSNREIGDALSLTEGTVKNHISKVLLKLGVRDRTRAVLKGLEKGLI